MATINTDISQKVDITIKGGDTVTIKLNVADSSGNLFPLGNYYVFFDVKAMDADDTIISASNINLMNTHKQLTKSRDDYFNITDFTIPANTAIDLIGVSSTGNETSITLMLSSSQSDLTPGTYRYKMKLLDVNDNGLGSNMKTWMYYRLY
jgi:hypothetical protein